MTADSTGEFVQYETTASVSTLRLDRPGKKNAIHDPMRAEFKTAVDRFEADESKVLIVTGTDDAFSTGADIDYLDDRLPETTTESLLMEDYALPEHLEAVDEPVLAMINGVAVGGGLELALACDVRFAVEDATIGFPEITLGGLPGEGGTQRLPREIGLGNALQLILSGELIDGDRAAEIGFIQEVHTAADIENEMMQMAHAMADHDRAALVLGKKATKLADRTEFQQGLELEGLLANVIETTPERQEHLREFLDA